MGEPINIVIVGSAGLETFHGRRGARDLVESLFFGPDAARAFCRRGLEPVEMEAAGGPLDGGTVVDEVRRVLLFWTDYDDWATYDVTRRRVLLALMAKVWEGWEVGWARGEALSTYLTKFAEVDAGTATGAFCDFGGHRDPDDAVRAARAVERSENVLSVRREDGSLRFFVTKCGGASPPIAPPSRLRRRWWRADGACSLDASAGQMPRSGTHVDFRARTVDLWSSALPGHDRTATQSIAKLFSGFQVEDRGDDSDAQLRACDGLLRFPVRDITALRASYR